MKKPVFEVDEQTQNDYEFRAKQFTTNGTEYLASDSLENLKKAIRERGWKIAWITSRSGSLSNGKKKAVEYTYLPKQ